jgi:hypothetical protein
MEPYVRKRYSLLETSDDAIKELMRNYFTKFYDLATCDRAEVITDAHVSGNDLPPR